jgi:N-acetylglucosamine-6-phosphate deacetylase
MRVEPGIAIQDATILTPHDRLVGGTVLIEGARIVAVGPADEVTCPPGYQVIGAAGLTLAPGFIDLQLNGAFGCDFTTDPTTIWTLAHRLPCYGVTAFLPTIITSPLATVATAQTMLAQGPPDAAPGAVPLGLHLEGPFLNPEKKGAHQPAYLRSPDLTSIAGWSPETGIRLATLAPELPGALDLIRTLAGRGVLVGAGHSLATYAEAQAGFEAGVRYGTHLFNAMPPLHHRRPGLIGALLADPRVAAGLIVDGLHVHPALVRLVWQLLGSARLNLVSDAMAGLGMPPGTYRLGEFEVSVGDAGARLVDGTLAGSTLSLDMALRNLLAYTGCSLADALPTVTTTPAALLGLAGQRGRIAPGYSADLVLLTPEVDVVMTLVKGQIAYSSDSFRRAHSMLGPPIY